ncbi:MAG TPA: DUF1697 domain-containing protein [Candidatus Krumholzibacteria bacterium]|nr:DUF1697 domain-containing protein [Candidatus Krumholzibacteria bacterium]
MTREVQIALLRGINVAGHNKLPMRELRSLCEELGWREVQSYIQSGNLVFRSASPAPRLEVALEKAIEGRFGFSISVLIRSAKDWSFLLEGNPFPRESESEPHRVMILLSKKTPARSALRELSPYAKNGERLRRVKHALWIHYPEGAGKSKLTPSVLERCVGSPVTARNWRTALKLEEIARST